MTPRHVPVSALPLSATLLKVAYLVRLGLGLGRGQVFHSMAELISYPDRNVV